MSDIQQIIKEIVDAYSRIPDCRGIALIGSRARGDAKQWSDIDIMSISTTEPTQNSRFETCKLLSDSDNSIVLKIAPMMRDSFKKSGFLVNVWHITQDIICDRVGSIEKRRRLESTMLVASLFESQLLFDPSHQLEVWKRTVAPVPDEYKSMVVPQIFAEVTSVIEDLANQHEDTLSFYTQHELIIAMESLFELLFLINGQYLNITHRIDSTLQNLKILPAGFLEKTADLLSCPSDIRGLRLRWRFLSELAKLTGELLRKNGFQIQSSWDQLKNIAPFLFKL